MFNSEQNPHDHAGDCSDEHTYQQPLSLASYTTPSSIPLL
ncbi:hypothetical protein APHDU1_0298 [Anaplasma phagocytophilum]|nr:hypothetical protein APHNYW_1025 [Anaplasma phagocytophilum str. ApNYW]KJV98192.1 hypothetical protein OTSANNIE_1281 [Anaplasma phagocytophilum str. Annie]KJZ99732.1 hypothetical protein APHDU1_0298 [Anaplasma phagocytophilum]